jgi:Rrf2 family protein
MKLSDGVEWGIHCCTVLAALPEGTALPAARLAEFHGVPAAYLAKHLQALSRAGIVTTEPGQRGGYRLARRPAEINLWDVVAAVDGSAPAFRCTEIRRRGPAALPDHRAEQAWRAELQATTLAGILADLASSVPPRAFEKAGAWFTEVLR